jgi:hypothetical protein
MSKAKVAQVSEWQAEDDARILANAKTIRSDPKRYKAAVGKAQEIATQRMQEARAMKSVANTKVKGSK